MTHHSLLNIEKGFVLEVSGQYACFTRPEMKVERVSYDVITPSAARAIFEAILWKPQIRWNIRQIKVLNKISYMNIKRNEIGKRMTDKNGLYIEDNRQQRASVILKDVKYHIHADFDLTDKAQASETVGKYVAMFARRAGKGQCYYRPYLGCREFSCDFKLIAAPLGTYPQNKEDKDDFQGDYHIEKKGYYDGDKLDIAEELKHNRDLGYMLYDMDYISPNNIQPTFFKAIMDEKGVIKVPDRQSTEVLR